MKVEKINYFYRKKSTWTLNDTTEVVPQSDQTIFCIIKFICLFDHENVFRFVGKQIILHQVRDTNIAHLFWERFLFIWSAKWSNSKYWLHTISQFVLEQNKSLTLLLISHSVISVWLIFLSDSDICYSGGFRYLPGNQENLCRFSLMLLMSTFINYM